MSRNIKLAAYGDPAFRAASSISVADGSRIIEARKRAKLSKTALAKACGVSWPTVNSWEKGEYEPNAENLEKIARATNQSMEWLRGKGPSEPLRLVESHVEPVDEHPLFARARKSGDYPEWVLDAAIGGFHHRDGRFEYHELIKFCDGVMQVGRDVFEATRPGPPKVNS